MRNNVGGGIVCFVSREEIGDLDQVVSGGDEGRFNGSILADLGHSDGAVEAVADAHSADGFFEFAAFFQVILDGFGGATVAKGAVVFAVGGAEITEIADAISLFVG